MKQDPLTRLLNSAAAARQQEPEPISNVLEGRIISAWKRGEPLETGPSVVPVFRWGFAISLGAACLALIVTAQTNEPNIFDEIAPVDQATLTYYP